MQIVARRARFARSPVFYSYNAFKISRNTWAVSQTAYTTGVTNIWMNSF